MSASAPSPAEQEAQRLAALQAMGALEAAPDPVLDQIAWLAAQLCGVPQAYVNLLDRDRCWVLGRAFELPGEPPAWVRGQAPCSQAVASEEALTEMADTTLHPPWSGQPALPGPRTVRFYAGALLRSPEGHALGTLCVVDEAPRQLTPEQRRALSALAAQASQALELARWRRGAKPEAEAQGDEATGAWSHDAFHQRLSEAWSRHARRGESIALLMLALGEGVAAELLPQVLRVVGESLRASDHLSRLPGQRFAVLLPGSGLGSAMNAAQRVRQAVLCIETERRDLGLCAGVAAMAPTPRGDPMQLLARAEHALRQTLIQGHPRIQPFSGWQA